MNVKVMKHIDRGSIAALATLLVVSVDTVRAQKQATTLFALAARTPLVLRARVQERREDGDRLRLTLTLVEALRGQAKVPLEISEGRAHHCGATCHGLEVGSELLVFADEYDGRLLVRGASRGLVHENAERTKLVRALLAPLDNAERLRLAIAAVASSDARIAEDAALALPTLPSLEQLEASDKARLRAALNVQLDSSSPALFGLVQAALRAEPSAAAAAAWRIWLDEDRGSWHGFAAEVLTREVQPQLCIDSLELASTTDQQRRRVASLFRETSSEARGDALLRQLASDDDERVRAEAVASLLLRGADPGQVTDGTRVRARAIVDATLAQRAKKRTFGATKRR